MRTLARQSALPTTQMPGNVEAIKRVAHEQIRLLSHNDRVESCRSSQAQPELQRVWHAAAIS